MKYFSLIVLTASACFSSRVNADAGGFPIGMCALKTSHGIVSVVFASSGLKDEAVADFQYSVSRDVSNQELGQINAILTKKDAAKKTIQFLAPEKMNLVIDIAAPVADSPFSDGQQWCRAKIDLEAKAGITGVEGDSAPLTYSQQALHCICN